MKKPSKLDNLRADLELIDTVIVSLFARREKMVLRIEKNKRKDGKPVFSKALEDRRINLAVETAKRLKMDKGSQKLVKKIFTAVITHCRKKEITQRKNAEKK
jgi:chorismate mutase